MPLITIIIPYHNTVESDRSALMHELLASIPDRDDVEVLLVDDASDMEYTPNRRFQRTRSRNLTLENGRYAGMARNFGIETAKGKYIVFADSDDKFAPNGVSDALEAISTMSDISPDIVMCRTKTLLATGEIASPVYDHIASVALKCRDISRLSSCNAPVGRIFRRAFLMEYEIRFDEIRLAEDAFFSVSAAHAASSAVFLEHDLYLFREPDGRPSLNATRDLSATRIRLQVVSRVNELHRKMGRGDLQNSLAPLIKEGLGRDVRGILHILNAVPFLEYFRGVIPGRLKRLVSSAPAGRIEKLHEVGVLLRRSPVVRDASSRP